jgi:hypothetical protein
VKVKRIDLDDEEMPERVLVELSHDEAAFLALLLGRQNSTTMNEALPGGSLVGTEAYEGLTGALFNRFYEDGVQGAVVAIRSRAD